MNSQSFCCKQRNIDGSILNFTLVDGIVIGGIHQKRQLRDDLVFNYLGCCIHSLVILVPIQRGGGLPPAELHCSFNMEPEMRMSPLL